MPPGGRAHGPPDGGSRPGFPQFPVTDRNSRRRKFEDYNAVGFRGCITEIRVKGWPIEIHESDLPAFQELVEAGIMKSNGRTFELSDTGCSQRNELLAKAEDPIERGRFDPPDGGNLSDGAKALLRGRLAGDDHVTAENLEAYRELSAAWIMYPVPTWAGGPESVLRFTVTGWGQRQERVKDERPFALHPLILRS